MNNDIKEILEDVKRHLDYVEATKQASIRDNEMKVMYDYITNLQEEYEKADIDRHILFEQKEKAIEYIPELRKSPSYELEERLDNLEYILQGEDNE